MGKERRKAPRFTIHQMIQIQFPKEEFVQAVGINLSETGLLCVTEIEIPAYTKVFIMLEMQCKVDTYMLKTDGVVIRSAPADGEIQTAIEFTSLFDNEKLKIQEYLEIISS